MRAMSVMINTNAEEHLSSLTPCRFFRGLSHLTIHCIQLWCVLIHSLCNLYPSPSNCLLCFPPYLHSGTVQPLWSALPEDLDTFLPFYSLFYCVQHPLPLSNIERREEEIRERQHRHEQSVVWSTSEATGQPHLDCIFMFVTPYKWTHFIEFWKCYI